MYGAHALCKLTIMNPRSPLGVEIMLNLLLHHDLLFLVFSPPRSTRMRTKLNDNDIDNHSDGDSGNYSDRESDMIVIAITTVMVIVTVKVIVIILVIGSVIVMAIVINTIAVAVI